MSKRPSVNTKSVSATLDRQLADRLEAYCVQQRLSRSQGIARAIEQFLDSVASEFREVRKRVAS